MIKAVIEASLRQARAVCGWWVFVFVISTVFALRLPSVLHGATDSIPNSPSDRTTQLLERQFGPGKSYPFVLVVTSGTYEIDSPDFKQAIEALDRVFTTDAVASQTQHYWNTGNNVLLGKDRKSVLVLIYPNVDKYFNAEESIEKIRAVTHSVFMGTPFSVALTGAGPMYHDLNASASTDLLTAERVAIPLTLFILLLVFRSPVAAFLPIIVAILSVTVSMAGLYFLSFWMPVSVFAQNAISMIGLGIGIDYALFIVARFRDEIANGKDAENAARDATIFIGGPLLFSGATVAIGFMALYLIDARFLHSLAVGGLMVVIVCLAATFTLLPVILRILGSRVNWPRKVTRAPVVVEPRNTRWSQWVRMIMAHPWGFAVAATIVIGLFVAPVARMSIWNVGAHDLAPDSEARRGADLLDQQFASGWMGPITLALHANAESLYETRNASLVKALSERLEKDPRLAFLTGCPQLLSLSTPNSNLQISARYSNASPISTDGKTCIVLLVPNMAPESAEVKQWVAEFREQHWPELENASIEVHVGGSTAMVADFDDEMLHGVKRVIPVVLGLTFAVLLLMFRSIVIPLKAIVMNLFSVLAAYGFLIYVFQDGIGAGLLQLTPPGGLNSFIVLMLFTLLFGLSMDYEVLLLSHIREHYERSGDTTDAVERGLAQTAGQITGAALIMITLFSSFGFTHQVATRQFGLGLAFAVLIDATLIRVIFVPTLMALLGSLNWWMPWGKNAPKRVE